MIIGIMALDLFTENSHSLKEKRHIVSSIKDKLKYKFNVSLIESDYQDLWQKIQITIVMAANKKVLAEKVFHQIEEIIFSNYDVQIIHVKKEYI
ncbi:MAG: DUF503 domain-containing protein [Candidatus Aminicenantes bacterium]|nr:DUF503 domain-containing protein [Candidatus Aminicenantes bacterium]